MISDNDGLKYLGYIYDSIPESNLKQDIRDGLCSSAYKSYLEKHLNKLCDGLNLLYGNKYPSFREFLREEKINQIMTL